MKEKKEAASWKEVFGVDYRSLALFRVCLAILILFDLYVRAKELTAHYTDFGVLPRGILVEKFANIFWVSIHMANGSLFFQIFLFLIAVLFAVALLLGYRTKIASIVSWFLLISLQSRNPLVLQGGDILFRMLLFWAMFLPLGERFSLDSMRKKIKQYNYHFSFASIGVLLQFAFVFVFAALIKTGREWFPDGTALYYALSVDQFATGLGKFLLGFPELMQYLTYFVFFAELIGPIFLFVPFFFGYIRIFAVFLFLILFIGMGANLNLGPFPWICSTALIVFLPALFWDKLFSLLKTKRRAGLKIYYDEQCSFCRKSVGLLTTFFLLPETQIIPAVKNRKVFSEMNKHNSWIVVDYKNKKYFGFDAFQPVFFASPILWPFGFLASFSFVKKIGNKFYYKFSKKRNCTINSLGEEYAYNSIILSISNFIALFFIIFIFLWNVQTLGYNAVPNAIEFIGPLTRVDQYWNMFAPYPLRDDGWYVVEGSLVDERKVDLMRNKIGVSFEKPLNVAAMYPHERWRKYLMNLWSKENGEHRGLYLSYLCRSWNKEHSANAEKLKSIKMYFMLEQTLPDYQKPTTEKILIAEWNCS